MRGRRFPANRRDRFHPQHRRFSSSRHDLRQWKKEFGGRWCTLGNSAIEVADGYVVAGALDEDGDKLNKSTGKRWSPTHNYGGNDAIEHLPVC